MGDVGIMGLHVPGMSWQEIRASAVLAASIFHFGQHTVGEAKEYLAARGISVRMVTTS